MLRYRLLNIFFYLFREEKESAVAKFNDIEEGAELPLNSEDVSSEPSTPLATEESSTANTTVTPVTQTTAVDECIWPSIGDLNNRVRRLISTCQRNFKKEEQKLVQKAKVSNTESYRLVFRQNIVSSQDLPNTIFRELFYPILKLQLYIKR